MGGCVFVAGHPSMVQPCFEEKRIFYQINLYETCNWVDFASVLYKVYRREAVNPFLDSLESPGSIRKKILIFSPIQ